MLNFLLFFSAEELLSNVNKKCFRGCVPADTLYPLEVFWTPLQFNFTNLTFTNYSEFAGKGHYSVVRKEQLTDGRFVAVKKLTSYSKTNLAKEIQVLNALKDVPNTLKLIGFIGNESKPSIVYSYHSSTPNAYYGNISLDNFKWWLRTALETLANIHERGIIHRDLRLSNIMANFETKEFAIIDFGLSDFYRENITKSPKVGCIHIKAPELAINMSNYGCAIDVWSLGLSCLDIMIKLRTNWDAKTNDQLIKYFIKYYGSSEWNSFADKYNTQFRTPSKSHGSIFELSMPGNNELLTAESIDLVKKMISLDPETRPTARECLQHPFFK